MTVTSFQERERKSNHRDGHPHAFKKFPEEIQEKEVKEMELGITGMDEMKSKMDLFSGKELELEINTRPDLTCGYKRFLLPYSLSISILLPITSLILRNYLSLGI